MKRLKLWIALEKDLAFTRAEPRSRECTLEVGAPSRAHEEIGSTDPLGERGGSWLGTFAPLVAVFVVPLVFGAATLTSISLSRAGAHVAQFGKLAAAQLHESALQGHR